MRNSVAKPKEMKEANFILIGQGISPRRSYLQMCCSSYGDDVLNLADMPLYLEFCQIFFASSPPMKALPCRMCSQNNQY
jgi:hypothetical protein